MKRVINFGLLICLIGLCQNQIQAQKIKIKKDFVYLEKSKEPSFIVKRTDPGGFLADRSYAITTLEGEPIISYNAEKIPYPKLPQETEEAYLFTTRILFHSLERDVIVPYLSMAEFLPFRKSLVKKAVGDKLIVDGELNAASVDQYITSLNEKNKTYIDQFKIYSAFRDSLLSHPTYKEYASQSLVSRGEGFEVESADLNGKKIVKFGGKRVGTLILKTNSSYGILWRIMGKEDVQVATIFYEKGKARFFVKTSFDDRGREFLKKTYTTLEDLNEMFAYLVFSGYL